MSLPPPTEAPPRNVLKARVVDDLLAEDGDVIPTRLDDVERNSLVFEKWQTDQVDVDIDALVPVHLDLFKEESLDP